MALKPDDKPAAIILMGVAGCGKTKVGQALADALGWPFYDGDDYHPQSNIDKMRRGIPLDDADRRSWLEGLHALLAEKLAEGTQVVLACSALKAAYRQILRGELQDVVFVHLAGSFELISSRLKARQGHYMKAEMLRSQFADLEPPEDALTVSIDRPVAEIVGEIIQNLNQQPNVAG